MADKPVTINIVYIGPFEDGFYPRLGQYQQALKELGATDTNIARGVTGNATSLTITFPNKNIHDDYYRARLKNGRKVWQMFRRELSALCKYID